MTKYVLNSGGIRNQPVLKKKFHHEIVAGLGNNPKFVLCNFAQGREYWENKFTSYSAAIAEDMPEGVQPTFALALPGTFVEQCKHADVIYFHGGDDELLLFWLKQFDCPALFTDKVIATNSASSQAVSTCFWTCDWRQCKDGMGILPIKFIAHYKSVYGKDDPRGPIDWEKACQDLDGYGKPNLPIYALKEGEYKVFQV